MIRIVVRNVVTLHDINAGIVDYAYVKGWFYSYPRREWYSPEYVAARGSKRASD